MSEHVRTAPPNEDAHYTISPAVVGGADNSSNLCTHYRCEAATPKCPRCQQGRTYTTRWLVQIRMGALHVRCIGDEATDEANKRPTIVRPILSQAARPAMGKGGMQYNALWSERYSLEGMLLDVRKGLVGRPSQTSGLPQVFG